MGRARISGVDSRWRDVWDPKTGRVWGRSSVLKAVDFDKFKETRAVWKSSK